MLLNEKKTHVYFVHTKNNTIKSTTLKKKINSSLVTYLNTLCVCDVYVYIYRDRMQALKE